MEPYIRLIVRRLKDHQPRVGYLFFCEALVLLSDVELAEFPSTPVTNPGSQFVISSVRAG